MADSNNPQNDVDNLISDLEKLNNEINASKTAQTTPGTSLEETLGDQKIEAEIQAEVQKQQVVYLKDHKALSSSHSDDGTLTLSVTGPTQLQLKYSYNGQDAMIRFEDGCLLVQMSDGTEFKVPVKARSQSKAKAA